MAADREVRHHRRSAAEALGDAELELVERRLERLATVLDSAWRIPGTGIRFGADAFLGLIPGVGDAASLGLSAYLIREARRLGAPPHLLRRMVLNVGIDTAVGAVPLLGDAFDLVFKSNKRNMTLLRGHLADVRSRRPKVINA